MGIDLFDRVPEPEQLFPGQPGQLFHGQIGQTGQEGGHRLHPAGSDRVPVVEHVPDRQFEDFDRPPADAYGSGLSHSNLGFLSADFTDFHG